MSLNKCKSKPIDSPCFHCELKIASLYESIYKANTLVQKYDMEINRLLKVEEEFKQLKANLCLEKQTNFEFLRGYMIKYFLLLSLSLTAMAADSSKVLKADEKLDFPPMTSKYCMVFDKAQNFVRCESIEIICYNMGKSFSQCFPKPPKPPEAVKPVAAPSKK